MLVYQRVYHGGNGVAYPVFLVYVWPSSCEQLHQFHTPTALVFPMVQSIGITASRIELAAQGETKL